MPRFGDLKRRLDQEGWVIVRKTDHYYYEKLESDGTLRRTKCSFSLSKEIPPPVVSLILKQTGWDRI